MSDDFPVPGPTGVPEYLEYDGGGPLPAEPPARRRGARPVLVGAVALAGLGLAGAGAWAAIVLSGGGPQPAEALPASTLGYLSVDLDPSADQKLEAIAMLKKFPAFEDTVGLDAQDDLRRELYEAIQEDADCTHLGYDADIEPWLGDRAAVAAVDTGGDTPDPVFAIQVKDDAAAEAGLAKIRNCALNGDADDDAGAADSETGFTVADGWALVSTSQDAAEEIAAEAEQGTLADDTTYQRWVEEVGDPGIVSMYLAPAAGTTLLDLLDEQSGRMGPGADTPQALEDFNGMAGTLRFDDGSLELEIAGDAGSDADQLYASAGAGALVAGLPADTAAAFGIGLTDGWFTQLVDQLPSGDGLSPDELLDSLSQQSGLDLPDDLETLLGEAAVLSVGGDLDPDALAESTDGSDVPVGLTVQGDPEAIEEVLDKLRAQLPPDQAKIIGSDANGDTVAIGPDSDYRSALLADGGSLGDSAAFRDVIGGADQAGVLLYVDFDAGDDWLVTLVQDDQELADNLEPLSALGLTAWVDGDVSHSVLRLTTD